MTVTMKDIARDLGVSVVTVSKALRNDSKISAATRKRVLRRAGELNYQTNWVARSLASGRTFTIGLLLPDFTHPFFAEIAKAVAQAVRPQGYHVIISYFEEDPTLEEHEADLLLARQVDGLIVASVQSSNHVEVFERMKRRKMPYVLIDRYIPGLNASFVGVDNKAIGRLAAEHLVETGCRRIAHLRGPDVGIARDRLEGCQRTLARHNLSMPENYIVSAGFGDDTGYEGMQKLLRQKSVPDGVFCYNDPTAIGAMKAVFQAGLRVPDDVAIVGAGNIHYSDLLAVPLTTIDQGTSETGTRAAELLLERIGSKNYLRQKKVLIRPKLVVRKSSLKPAPQSTD